MPFTFFLLRSFPLYILNTGKRAFFLIFQKKKSPYRKQARNRPKSDYGILDMTGKMVYIRNKQDLKKRHSFGYGIFSDLT